MAEQTEYVNYQGFKKHIETIHTLGEVIRANIDSAYIELGKLKTATGWKGPQYDKLVKSFNDMKSGFDTILDDIGYKIPNMMNTAASSWAKVDGATFGGVSVGFMKKITELFPSSEPALTWNKTAVDESKQAIEHHLDEAVNAIKELAVKFGALNVDWKGKDYDDNLKDIQSYQNDVAAKVDELKADFVKYMNESISAYDTVRSAVAEWK